MDGSPLREEPSFSQKEIFDELCPYYMAMGMTYAEYWQGSPRLAIVYRKKKEIEREEKNEWLWWQGYYNFVAVSTVVGNVLKKKSSPALEYLKKPIEIIKKEEPEEIKKERAKKEAIEFLQMQKSKYDLQQKLKGSNTDEC